MDSYENEKLSILLKKINMLENSVIEENITFSNLLEIAQNINKKFKLEQCKNELNIHFDLINAKITAVKNLLTSVNVHIENIEYIVDKINKLLNSIDPYIISDTKINKINDLINETLVNVNLLAKKSHYINNNDDSHRMYSKTYDNDTHIVFSIFQCSNYKLDLILIDMMKDVYFEFYFPRVDTRSLGLKKQKITNKFNYITYQTKQFNDAYNLVLIEKRALKDLERLFELKVDLFDMYKDEITDKYCNH